MYIMFKTVHIQEGHIHRSFKNDLKTFVDALAEEVPEKVLLSTKSLPESNI